MSRQLAVSAAFSILAMAAYVLFGADVARAPLTSAGDDWSSPLQIAAPELPAAKTLLPTLR
jgi:hypothetical protein